MSDMGLNKHSPGCLSFLFVLFPLPCRHLKCIFIVASISLPSLAQNYELTTEKATYYNVELKLSYKNPQTGNLTEEHINADSCRSSDEHAGSAKGKVYLPQNEEGCLDYRFYKPMPSGPWIALVKKGGGCPLSDKVAYAMRANASGILFYHHDISVTSFKFSSSIKNSPIVVTYNVVAEKIKELLANNTKVNITLTKGSKVVETIKVEKSSVLFVSVSFIVLMIISLAWLVFYYIQRFRYAQARDRTQKRLSKAAKKALTKIPVKSVREEDFDTKDGICPICLEFYRTAEAIRILPCSHFFHTKCVDQWLIDHRTCPMCKTNILKALGYQQSLPPQLSEEALYALEISQLMFGPSLDDDPLDIDSRSSEVETVRVPLPNQINLPRGNVVHIVMLPSPCDGAEADVDEREGESIGSKSSEGIPRPVTTTVEMHRQQTHLHEYTEQNPLIPHTSV